MQSENPLRGEKMADTHDPDTPQTSKKAGFSLGRIIPLALLAAYMLYVGVSGVRKGAPAGEPIGNSGKMMAVVSVLGFLQALVPIFFVEKHFDTYVLAVAVLLLLTSGLDPDLVWMWASFCHLSIWPPRLPS